MACNQKPVIDNSISIVLPSTKDSNLKLSNQAKTEATTITNDVGSRGGYIDSFFIQSKLEYNNLSISEDALSVGKKKTVFEETLLGPSLNERKGIIDIANVFGNVGMDLFRLAGARYWAFDKENKEFKYLNGEGNSLPFVVVDYNFIKERTNKISDVSVENSKEDSVSQKAINDSITGGASNLSNSIIAATSFNKEVGKI